MLRQSGRQAALPLIARVTVVGNPLGCRKTAQIRQCHTLIHIK